MKSDTEFNLTIDYNAPLPVYQQVKQGVIYLIAAEKFVPGVMLPSVRDLAGQLGINPNTVLKAYYQLEIEGYLLAQPGRGYYVAKKGTDPQKVKETVFEELSKEYLNKVLRLGYTLSEVKKELMHQAAERDKK